MPPEIWQLGIGGALVALMVYWLFAFLKVRDRGGMSGELPPEYWHNAFRKAVALEQEKVVVLLDDIETEIEKLSVTIAQQHTQDRAVLESIRDRIHSLAQDLHILIGTMSK